MSFSDTNKIKINFENLNNFTGNNLDFTKQLISAFQSELEHFLNLIKEKPSQEEFLIFRKAHHSISPSLQMMELENLHQLIEAYKAAFIDNPEILNASFSQLQKGILELINEINLWQSLH